MKSTVKLLVQTSVILLIVAAAATGYASQDKARAVEVIANLNHAGGHVGTYHALLVGINDYEDPKIPDLETPVNDVNEMTTLLRTKYGFEVSRLINSQASKEGIYNALRQLAGTAKSEDSVLIYFAGHGDQDRLIGGGWWIPWDAKHGNSVSYFDNVLTQKLIASMKVRHVLLISDSCYSGTLFGETARALPPVITDKYYLELFNEKSRWGMTAGNLTPVADRGTEGHSVFAYQLIKALKKNSKPYLSTQELYTGFAAIVANNSEQSPMCRPIKSTGDQGGEFVFILAGGPGPEPVVPMPPAEQKQAWLSVEANVAGADVLVDGRSVGKVPLRDYELAPGDHRITVTSRGYGDYERIYTFRPGRSRDVNVLLAKAKPGKCSLTVETSPEDAVIRIMNIKGKYQRRMELDPGSYHVRVLAPGYDTQNLWIEIDQGEDKTIAVSLEKTGGTQIGSLPPEPESPKPGKTWKEPTTGMEFVWVPGGCFQMGDSFGDGDSDEKPVHEVCVDGFWMGKYEVTQAQYRKVTGQNPSWFKADTRPVENVSWNDAKSFILQLNNRLGRTFSLPTEAQWEYAARERGKKVRFGTGKNIIGPDEANFDGRQLYKESYSSTGGYRSETVVVGSFAPNNLGLFDMSGNVWEWCEDVYDADAYSKHSNKNPVISSGSSLRVYRGGSWIVNPKGVRTAYRDGLSDDYRYGNIGFRLCFVPEFGSQQ